MIRVERLLSGSLSAVQCLLWLFNGAVWVDKQSDHYRTQTPKLSSPDGYRLGITPSQYCIKPTLQNRVSSCTTILLTCPLKNYVILVLQTYKKQSSLALNVLSKQRHFSEQNSNKVSRQTFKILVAANTQLSTVSILNSTSETCLLYTSPSPRDGLLSRMPSSA